MNWNVCEMTVLLSENLQSIGKKFQPATEKQTDTFTDYFIVSFL